MSAKQNQGIFQIGDVLNNTYRIEEVLGRGGTSEVYKARSEISGRVMALKALRLEFSRNDDFLALMTREEEMRDIRHDAIVRYYDNQRTDDGLVYLVMDYVEGPGLDQKIDDGGMSAEDLMIVARRVTQGLRAAHDKKIVHRDLSPDNIILRHGNPADAVIIDFGIAKDTNEGAQTIVGNEFAGKYAYAAPEQLSGQTDARADIYALGALLLATFRGVTPKIGSNPMEVVNLKTKPLDTSGVPEPLKSLIDRMTHPDREARLPSAQAVLDHIDQDGDQGGSKPVKDTIEEIDPDKTVIAALPDIPPAVPAKAPAAKAPPKPAPPQKNTKPTDPEKAKSGGGVKAIAAVVLVGALGAGGYFGGFFDGLLGPGYPLADPYLFTAERLPDAAPSVVGNMPSEEARDEIIALMDELGGSAEVTLASGDLPPDWGDDIAQVIGIVSVLPEWRVEADGAELLITGETGDATQRAQLMALLTTGGLPGGLTGTTNIAYAPPILTAGALAPILSANENCGALQLMDPPATGYGPDDQVLVLGKVADVESRVALSDALTAAIGGRDLILNVDVLNPTLCLVDAVLPDVPAGGFDLIFSLGDDGSENASGRYFVGENPVIDVVIPAEVTTGYLYVTALDVSGDVFHLLPNQYIANNAIEDLRAGQDGTVKVRLAHSAKVVEDNAKLAFYVDDSTLGKTKIIVIYAEEPLFGGLRPSEESAAGYVEALRNETGVLRTLDSRILTTSKP